MTTTHEEVGDAAERVCARPDCGRPFMEHIGWQLGHFFTEPKGYQWEMSLEPPF